jgi:hypothetical protein
LVTMSVTLGLLNLLTNKNGVKRLVVGGCIATRV